MIVTEWCPHCENEISMSWDVEKMGYQVLCPECGRRLMLCSECLDSGDGACDYYGGADRCYRMKGAQIHEHKYT